HTFKHRLRDYIFKSAEGKSWLYHPRQARVSAAAIERLKQHVEAQSPRQPHEPDQNRAESLQSPTSSGALPNDATDYVCRKCEARWQGRAIGLNPCPTCETHLYRIAVS